MESPVVVDKPPEYKNADSERGFPFEDEGAWSGLAARHPDIAARLRQQRPANWARKRRPSGQDAGEDFPEDFSGFERFPFDDIPPEFRGHFPSHWNRRYGPEEQQAHSSQNQPPPPPQQHQQQQQHHHQQQQQQQQPQQPAPQQQQPQRATIATQTDPPEAVFNSSEAPQPVPQENLNQHGYRNTVDLGQESQPDPGAVDDRGRSSSAPPDNMSGQSPPRDQSHDPHSNVRHIPIFVEGRDRPVINRNNAQYAEKPAPAYSSPPHAHSHPDREQYFPEEGFHHPPNFSRTFGGPFKQGFRPPPQPFAQQKVFPQAAAFGRGTSPQRHSPARDEFVNVPVHHERATPSPQPHKQATPQQQQQQYQQQQQQKFQQQQQQQAPPQQQSAPKPPPPTSNDPITTILAIQTDVLNLMNEVENFKGSKKDKNYMFLDEMLTRNLIKLDNIETDGKENIRQARKEAIKCIQKCISVLESKADKGNQQPDVDMDNDSKGENGEVEMKAKEETNVAPTAEAQTVEPSDEPQAADTRPADQPPADQPATEDKPAETDKKPKKKVVKKRDKSKDKKEPKDSVSVQDSNKSDSDKKIEAMQVDKDKLDNSQNAMEVDGAAASQ